MKGVRRFSDEARFGLKNSSVHFSAHLQISFIKKIQQFD